MKNMKLFILVCVAYIIVSYTLLGLMYLFGLGFYKPPTFFTVLMRIVWSPIYLINEVFSFFSLNGVHHFVVVVLSGVIVSSTIQLIIMCYGYIVRK